MACKAHSFLCNFFGYAVHLKENATRFYYCNPVFWRTFTGTHACFCRFSRYWLIREYFNPNLTTTFDITRHSNTCCFNLTVSNPSWFKSNKTILTMADSIAAMSFTFHTATELFTIFNSLW